MNTTAAKKAGVQAFKDGKGVAPALEPTMRFRKKPVVVDAVKWLAHGDHPAVEPYADHAHWGWINTLEGGHIVTPGDWIITGVKGEHYPCKPDIFELTYEPA